MRPNRLEDVVGQTHLLGDGHILARAIRSDRIPSMILWGPPGSGKTTLARIIASTTRSRFVTYSATSSSMHGSSSTTRTRFSTAPSGTGRARARLPLDVI